MKVMFKVCSVLFIIAATCLPASAQLPGSWGISSTLGTSSSTLNLLFAASPTFQLELGVGLTSVSYSLPTGMPEVDAEVGYSASVAAKIFLSTGDIMPFINIGAGYAKAPSLKQSSTTMEATAISIIAGFGGQAFVTKRLALFATTGVNVALVNQKTSSGSSSIEQDQTQISLFTSSVGASFYF